MDPAGIEPASPGFQPSANPSQLGIHVVGLPFNRQPTARSPSHLPRPGGLTVGRQGLEPRPPGPKPGALTLTPHPADRLAESCLPPLLRAAGRTAAVGGRNGTLSQVVDRLGFEPRTFSLQGSRSANWS